MVTLACDRTTVPAYAAATKWSKNSSEIDSASSNCRQKILQAILAICYSLQHDAEEISDHFIAHAVRLFYDEWPGQ